APAEPGEPGSAKKLIADFGLRTERPTQSSVCSSIRNPHSEISLFIVVIVGRAHRAGRRPAGCSRPQSAGWQFLGRSRPTGRRGGTRAYSWAWRPTPASG